MNFTAQIQASLKHVQPNPTELQEMSQKAHQIVRLLEDLKRASESGDSKEIPQEQQQQVNQAISAINGMTAPSAASSSVEDHRPPKRPWEDMSQEAGPSKMSANSSPGGTFNEVCQDTTPHLCLFSDAREWQPFSATSDKPLSQSGQSMAEQDMELIRTKRATSGSSAPSSMTAQPSKNKYKKRSVSIYPFYLIQLMLIRLLDAWSGQRATPPGKCHACGINETPEWRRGPDGARTLCNACGLRACSFSLEVICQMYSVDCCRLRQTRQETNPTGRAWSASAAH